MATSIRKSRGGGDLVLEGRHLVGIFALLVVVLGVVFTLGYVLGRSQYDTKLRVAEGFTAPGISSRTPTAAGERTDKSATSVNRAAKNGSAADGGVVSSAPDWDFYHSGESVPPSEQLPPRSTSPSSASAKSIPAAAQPTSSGSAKLSVRHDLSRTNGVPSNKAVRNQGVNAKGIVPLSTRSPLLPNGAIVLQVAAVVRQSDALAEAQALQKKKFPAFVVTPQNDHFYRVQVGPYADLKSANSAQKRLESQGFKSIIKR